MSELEELAETGFGSLVLAFGVVTGATVYSSGSLDAIPIVVDQYATALRLAFLPALSVAVWPNLVAGLTGVVAAVRLEDRTTVRVATFVAVYLFLAIVIHYAVAPA
ncbi:hypothetical protein [Natrononativus amylolyticus]|uniref:hypothetical protein n=1 Tax=Natrononativus amylolyticus TaxID=2963434 RepID=UPI0020CE4130|nr:hypothetical protein [Natrononativus amylolyticus]